jgi:RimJ/RimL family protein N-acetyltransferase
MAFGPIMRFTVGDLRIELAPFAKSDMGEFISLEYGGGMWQFSVRKYTGRTNAPTLEDEEEHYEKVRKAIDRLVWGIWVITVIDGTEQRLLIGVSDLFGFDEGGTKLIQQATSGSMIFNKEYWGKGIASAAHKARTWYAFTQLGLHRIKSAVLQANTLNTQAVLDHPSVTAEHKAGILVVLATSAISHAAFALARLDPHLSKAPPEAQIADFLDMISDVMTTPGSISGGLSVVKGGKATAPDQTGGLCDE